MTRLTSRIRRGVAVLCAAAIPFVLTTSAEADSAGSFGWWYQLNDSRLPIAPPPPPGAPASGIYVQGTLAGPSAYGAVRFSSPGATAGVAQLAVESSTGAVEVAVCPTTSTWQAADAGPWQSAPAFDCSATKAIGVLTADGTALTFQLTDAFGKAGEYDLAIVPDPTAQTVFSLSLTAPGPDFFTPTSTTPPTVPPVEEVPSAVDTGAVGGGFEGGGTGLPDSGSTTNAGNFLEPPPTTPPISTPTGDTTPSGVGGVVPTQPVSRTESGAERVGSAIGLALLAAALWVTGNRSAGGLTPELVRAGAISAQGGVGRFARVRTALPTRVA